MIDTAECFDPVDYYDKHLLQSIKENASNYFDDLVKKSKIDTAKNEETVRQINKKFIEKNKGESEKKKYHNIKIALIVISVIGFITALGSFIFLFSNASLSITLTIFILSLIIAIGCLILYFVKIKKKLAKATSNYNKIENELNELIKSAQDELFPLNVLFSYNDDNNIIRKTTDIFSIDDVLSWDNLYALRTKYGMALDINNNTSVSVYNMKSGSIKKNPFIKFRFFREQMINHTYTGSIVVPVTYTTTDSKGRTQVRTRMETVYGYYTAPMPNYFESTLLVYGNMAAPDLKFSRQPNPNSSLRGKQLDNYIKDRSKDFEKKAEDAVKVGESFQPLANMEFECLFNAMDRNNEVEYRLLFTPLAQQNMLEILQNKYDIGYGDDFSFTKLGKINVLQSQHGENITDYNPYALLNEYSYKTMKEKFVQNITDIFHSLYFDLAPLLSIPLYQLNEADTLYEKQAFSNITDYEAESFTNHIDQEIFRPLNTVTGIINKVLLNKSVGQTDIYDVTSYSFGYNEKVAHVTATASDGSVHSIPVIYREYFPNTKTTTICIQKCPLNNLQFSALNLDDDYQKLVSENQVFTFTPQRHKCFIGYVANSPDDINLSDKISKMILKFMK